MGKVVYFVVGDQKLDAGGGVFVRDLEELKARLMKTSPKGDWHLVIGMHGSVELLSTVGGVVDAANRPKDLKLYFKDDIEKLFAQDQQFQAWRTQFGPSRLTLNSCQVDKPFESAIIASITKPSSSQSPQGLGKGCQPLTNVQTYQSSGGVAITTRAQWGALSKSEKEDFKKAISELNKNFGYFGSPPVPETLLLDFYFDEPPKGGWPVVTVRSNEHDTGISYFNRAQNVKFLSDACQEHLGPGRGHTPTAPPDPD